MVSSTWLIVRAPLTKNRRDFGVYIHSENTYSSQGMPQSPKCEVTAMHGVGVSRVMNHWLMDPVGVLALHPPTGGCCGPPAPSRVPDSNERARGWLPSPPATSSKLQLLVESISFFGGFFFFLILINFNKAKLIVRKMKKQILQQSYPSDNSSQFATKFLLTLAMERGLYFFF